MLKFLSHTTSLLTILLGVSICSLAQAPAPFYIPKPISSRTILSAASLSEKQYLAFPTSLQLDDEHILIAFKRGTSHGGDNEADADAMIYNTSTKQVTDHFRLGTLSGKIFQLTVPLRTADGTIKLYTDLQNRGQDGKNYRDGMRYSVFNPITKTTSTWEKLPEIEGIEYGYPFDFIVEGQTVYMLAMSFGYRPGNTWSVAVLRSDDGAASWKFVKNITDALGGGPINESSFIRQGTDFLIVSRGYPGQATRIARFDKNFNVLKVADLTGEGKPLLNYIGWPRLFEKGNALYVLGRIWPAIPNSNLSSNMKQSRLGLIRINAQSLEVEKVAMLDNAEGQLPVTDAYYATWYWKENAGKATFNTITYRALEPASAPDIIEFSFLWDDAK